MGTVVITTYFNHPSSSFSVSSYRNLCLSYLLVEWKLSLDRGSVCLPAVTASPCSLNSGVLLLQQARLTGVLSRHFRRLRRRQPSRSKTPFLVAFGLFNVLKSWVESYAGYRLMGLPSDSVPGENNFLFPSRKWLCMRGGRGFSLV